MPIVIGMLRIWQAGKTLAVRRHVLADGVVVGMEGAGMRILENEEDVFTMKTVSIVDDPGMKSLLIDFPKVKDGQEGRGWGMIGALLTFYYGLEKGCTNVQLGSQIEGTPESTRFWRDVGIQNMTNNPLRHCMDTAIEWVVTKCPQREKAITEFVVRDKQPKIEKKDNRSEKKPPTSDEIARRNKERKEKFGW